MEIFRTMKVQTDLIGTTIRVVDEEEPGGEGTGD